MKYLTPLFLTFLLIGCSGDKKATQDTSQTSAASENSITNAMTQSPVAQEVIIKYQDKNKKTYELKTTDNFQTAVLVDSNGKTYDLKEVMAGSGMRLEGRDGIYIHTKGENATLELSKGKPVDIKALE